MRTKPHMQHGPRLTRDKDQSPGPSQLCSQNGKPLPHRSVRGRRGCDARSREEGQAAAGSYPSAFSLTDAETKVQIQPKPCKNESMGVWQPCKAGGQQHPAAGLFGERGTPTCRALPGSAPQNTPGPTAAGCSWPLCAQEGSHHSETQHHCSRRELLNGEAIFGAIEKVG